MKKNIHPNLNTIEAVCTSCNFKSTVVSTASDIKTEICSNCHPFYTGKKKYMDIAGKLDKFNKIQEQAALKKKALEGKQKSTSTKDPKEETVIGSSL